MKFLPLLICGSLLAPIQDIPDEVIFYKRISIFYRNLYPISCTNLEFCKLLNEQLSFLSEKTVKEMQQILIHRFKEYVRKHSEYCNMREVPKEFQASLSELDPDVRAFFALQRDPRLGVAIFLDQNALLHSGSINAPVPSIDLSDLWFNLQKFANTLQTKVWNYKYIPGENENIYQEIYINLTTSHDRYIPESDNDNERNVVVLPNSFSCYQLTSDIFPYFGLICHSITIGIDTYADQIWGVMKFESDDANFRPYFYRNCIYRTNRNELIKFIATNLILAGFVEYENNLLKAHFKLPHIPGFEYYYPEWLYEVLVPRAVGLIEPNDLSDRVDETYRQALYGDDYDAEQDNRVSQEHIPLLIAPIYHLDPDTKQPLDPEAFRLRQIPRHPYLELIQ